MNIDLDDEDWKGKATPNDLDKARSTIRQLYRDWSHEGAEERDACYNPIFGALADYFGEHPLPRRHIRVLVPGSGLSRLPLELFKAGYTVVANEVSHHQTMAADYIMNGKLKPHHHDLYPFALSFSNHRTRGDQLTKVSIPDLDVHTVLNGWPDPHARPTRSTVGGDFCVAFRAPRFQERYEAVVTCFFVRMRSHLSAINADKTMQIDTAPNLIYYVDTMKHCLRTSGIWVNIGPLLWHAESRTGENETVGSERQSSTTAEVHLDIPERIGINEPGTFELSDDEVKQLVTESGFEIIEARQTDPVGYIQNSGSMLQHIYQPSFWVARKLDEKAE